MFNIILYIFFVPVLIVPVIKYIIYVKKNSDHPYVDPSSKNIYK